MPDVATADAAVELNFPVGVKRNRNVGTEYPHDGLDGVARLARIETSGLEYVIARSRVLGRPLRQRVKVKVKRPAAELVGDRGLELDEGWPRPLRTLEAAVGELRTEPPLRRPPTQRVETVECEQVGV